MDNLNGATMDKTGSGITPMKNPKYRHIAKSAAKRESVQMLGSIKDLQLRFSEAGLEHRDGSGAGVRGLDDIRDEGNDENRPPLAGSSRDSKGKERTPWKEVELPRLSPKEARREARSLVGNVRSLWGLGMPSSPSMAFSLSPLSPVSPTNPKHQQDTRTTLVNTAEAIRKTRSLAIAVSSAPGGRKLSSGPSNFLPTKSKMRASISTPSRPNSLPRAVSHPNAERKSSTGSTQDDRPDEIAQLRRAALEVLAGLRHLEERLRTESTGAGLMASQELRRAVSPGMDESSGSSIPDTESYKAASTILTEPDSYNSEDEEYNLNSFAREDDEEHLLTWEERIVSENRLYKPWTEGEGSKVDSVRDSIRKWVGVAENVFGARDRNGMEELESWVKEEMWSGWSIERAHAFLLAHLPLNLQLLLPNTRTENFRDVFLARLSDGYLLTQALNIALLSSSKPWGFISEYDIHDTISSEATSSGRVTPEGGDETKKDKSYTFMRIGNLTCWAAALRHRYNLPINIPHLSSNLLAVPPSLPPPRSPSPENSPTVPSSMSVPTVPEQREGPAKRRTQRAPKDNGPKIEFDPAIVAKKGEGWEAMLGGLIKVWVEEAAREVREDVGVDMMTEEETLEQ